MTQILQRRAAKTLALLGAFWCVLSAFVILGTYRWNEPHQLIAMQFSTSSVLVNTSQKNINLTLECLAPAPENLTVTAKADVLPSEDFPSVLSFTFAANSTQATVTVPMPTLREAPSEVTYQLNRTKLTTNVPNRNRCTLQIQPLPRSQKQMEPERGVAGHSGTSKRVPRVPHTQLTPVANEIEIGLPSEPLEVNEGGSIAIDIGAIAHPTLRINWMIAGTEQECAVAKDSKTILLPIRLGVGPGDVRHENLSLLPGKGYKLKEAATSVDVTIHGPPPAHFITVGLPKGPLDADEGTMLSIVVGVPAQRDVRLKATFCGREHQLKLLKGSTSILLEIPDDDVPAVDHTERLTLLAGDGYDLIDPTEVLVNIHDPVQIEGEILLVVLVTSELASARGELDRQFNDAQLNGSLCGNTIYAIHGGGITAWRHLPIEDSALKALAIVPKNSGHRALLLALPFIDSLVARCETSPNSLVIVWPFSKTQEVRLIDPDPTRDRDAILSRFADSHTNAEVYLIDANNDDQSKHKAFDKLFRNKVYTVKARSFLSELLSPDPK